MIHVQASRKNWVTLPKETRKDKERPEERFLNPVKFESNDHHYFIRTLPSPGTLDTMSSGLAKHFANWPWNKSFQNLSKNARKFFSPKDTVNILELWTALLSKQNKHKNYQRTACEGNENESTHHLCIVILLILVPQLPILEGCPTEVSLQSHEALGTAVVLTLSVLWIWF